MWIKFTSDFDFKPKPSVTMSFKVGDTFNATRECADAAFAAKAAIEMQKQTREGEPTPVTGE